MVTVAQLQHIFPKAKVANLAAFCDEINEAAVEFEIDSPRRLAAFLAQCAHESGGFKFLKENESFGNNNFNPKELICLKRPPLDFTLA